MSKKRAEALRELAVMHGASSITHNPHAGDILALFGRRNTYVHILSDTRRIYLGFDAYDGSNWARTERRVAAIKNAYDFAAAVREMGRDKK